MRSSVKSLQLYTRMSEPRGSARSSKGGLRLGVGCATRKEKATELEWHSLILFYFIFFKNSIFARGGVQKVAVVDTYDVPFFYSIRKEG